jgi:hypothetical protein
MRDDLSEEEKCSTRPSRASAMEQTCFLLHCLHFCPNPKGFVITTVDEKPKIQRS